MFAGVDWAVVIATFVGPIVAVGITLWAQARDSHKRNRMELFSNMMRSRRSPTAIEFVGSLNLVPVHFHSDQAVISRYADLMAIFSDSSWRSKDQEAIRQINEKAELAIAYLLSAMSRVLGVPIEQLAILRGAYAPQGWADEEQLNRETRLLLRDLLSGHRFLPVLPVPHPPPSDEGEISTTSDDNGRVAPGQ
ncbi:DUF6680 family protein [Microvirga lenta]|uniref:DUF6680 family protein n=1 Tax=Microvirga lenta TaxID=2881337 RepID=UPI001CFFEA6A|nr:DUF6680 family protein [Microvirga lenta]MCB5177580.1 hypothetical protein [Microvirga lenta]